MINTQRFGVSLTVKARSIVIDLRAGTNEAPSKNLRCLLIAMTVTTPFITMRTADIASRGQYSGGGSGRSRISISILTLNRREYRTEIVTRLLDYFHS